MAVKYSKNQQSRDFVAEYDQEGVYVYQAFNDTIADFALEHQTLGGPAFRTSRMTWFKPSFAWMLYRSGYGRKRNQTRILKIKLSHETLGSILAQNANSSNVRLQWDPARDILTACKDGRSATCVPSKAGNGLGDVRAIQIGVSGPPLVEYVSGILNIKDVTSLATEVGDFHEATLCGGQQDYTAYLKSKVESLLPAERSYVPYCSRLELLNLGMNVNDTEQAR